MNANIIGMRFDENQQIMVFNIFVMVLKHLGEIEVV